MACAFNRHGAFYLKGFTESLGIPEDYLDDPLTAADWWTRNGRDRSWRQIIYSLDWAGGTEVAEELIPYTEPPPGVLGLLAKVCKVYIYYFLLVCNCYMIVPQVCGVHSDLLHVCLC